MLQHKNLFTKTYIISFLFLKMSKFFISKCHKNITLCFELIYINITEYIRYESQNTLIMLLLAPVSPIPRIILKRKSFINMDSQTCFVFEIPKWC